MSTVLQDSTSAIVVGELAIDQIMLRAYWRDKQVALTKREFFLVRALVEKPNEYVSLEDCYARYRGDDAKTTDVDGTTRVIVSRVRRKFEAVDARFNNLVCHKKHYRWVQV